jgi:hypothetical protein
LSAMKIQYANTTFPRQSSIDILFQSTDAYPIVPVCQRNSNGLLQIIPV